MKKIHQDDLKILAAIFFPHYNCVMAPQDGPLSSHQVELLNGRTVLGLPNVNMACTEYSRQASALIVFGNEPPPVPGFQYRRLDVVKNPDGSIRWIYPPGNTSPVFLKLYNGSGWRGKLFRAVFTIGFAMGFKKYLNAGSIWICHKKKQLLDDLLEMAPGQQSAIFTGTPGDNRKAVFVFGGNNGGGRFFKLPLTESARALVLHEEAALQALQGHSFDKIIFPDAVAFGGGVWLSDIRPARFRNLTELQPIHVEALKEIQAKTYQERPLGALPAWAAIGKALGELETLPIKNDLPTPTVDFLLKKLSVLYRSFDPSTIIPSTIAHGDFTPWNMYPAASGILHLYDWELSERLPVLYDAFHFIFQSSILIQRIPFATVHERVISLKCNSSVQDMLNNNLVSFDWAYRFYLLRNISYYLRKYVEQQPLHPQAHWLLETWKQALLKVADEG